MDAATRSTSTPLGQVENPILNAFDSEYFLGPGKKGFVAILTYVPGYCLCYIYYAIRRRHLIQRKNLVNNGGWRLSWGETLRSEST